MGALSDKVNKLQRFVSDESRNLVRYRSYVCKCNVDPTVVLFEQQCGLTPDGNMYWMARQIQDDDEFRDLKIAFVVDPSIAGPIANELAARGFGGELVIRRSRRYYELLATAGYLVCDTTFPPEFAKREGQVLLNTWHGTPLKTLGRAARGELARMGNTQRCFGLSDILLFPNGYTRDKILRGYMPLTFGNPVCLLGGYPRNAILLQEEMSSMRRLGKKIYAYMPTFRGGPDGGADMVSRLIGEMDSLLADDEELLVRLHPVLGGSVDLSSLRHVRPFSCGVEAYEVLADCDALLTDYSSVMFDYAVTRRTVVLLVPDEQEYLQQRGAYLDFDELPFPRAEKPSDAIELLRTSVEYDDSGVLERFCPYDSSDAAERLCRRVFLGERGLLREEVEELPRPVLVFSSNPYNDITDMLYVREALIGCGYGRVALAFPQDALADGFDVESYLPPEVDCYVVPGKVSLTTSERVVRVAAKSGVIGTNAYARAMRDYHEYEVTRMFGLAEFDAFVYYESADWWNTCLFANVNARRTIMVRSNGSLYTGKRPRDYEAFVDRAFDELVPSH